MIIVGLGNPLSKFKETRHNVGFMVVDKLAKHLSVKFVRHSKYQIAQSKEPAITLLKPMIYMNNSGIVISEYLCSIKTLTTFIVVCDDMALPLGRIRIREKGSDGGHQGLASIIYHLRTINFPRLRIGIGHPQNGTSAADYVLAKFSSNEKSTLKKVIDISCAALIKIYVSGIKVTMNQYNTIQIKPLEIKSQ